MGERLHFGAFWGRLDQNCGYHGNRKLPLTYNGKNGVCAFSQSPLIRSLSNLQITRTGIISQDEFEFGLDQTFRYGVIHPWAFPLTLNGENGVSISTRTDIKSRTCFNSVHIWPVNLELRALEQWKKWCLQLFSVTFDWIFLKLAGNEDRHKSSNKFEFGPDRDIHFGVTHPWGWKFFS